MTNKTIHKLTKRNKLNKKLQNNMEKIKKINNITPNKKIQTNKRNLNTDKRMLNNLNKQKVR